MTVLAVRVLASPGNAEDRQYRFDQQVRAEHNLALEEVEQPFTNLSEPDIHAAATDYAVAEFRFEPGPGMTDIVHAVKAAVASGDWWAIQVHECDHDTDSTERCGDWQTVSSRGPVPDGL